MKDILNLQLYKSVTVTVHTGDFFEGNRQCSSPDESNHTRFSHGLPGYCDYVKQKMS